jgi:uncharacterized protein
MLNEPMPQGPGGALAPPTGRSPGIPAVTELEVGGGISAAVPPLSLILMKVAARCNLDCTYCYEFNLADATWRDSPVKMSPEVFSALLSRLRRHIDRSGQTAINLSFHGGEPTMIGLRRFNAMVEEVHRVLPDIAIRISLQTNGTLLTRAWADALVAINANIGVSLDGPPDINDAARVDRRGRGSHARVLRGLEHLNAVGARYGFLTVIPLGADPLYIHHHFLSLGCRSLSYLMPDLTHETIGDLRQRFGPTPCADFLVPVFDDWWFNSTMDIRIRNFWDMARLIMGGRSGVDALGNQPLGFVAVAANGDVEGLDVLKACGDGFVKTGINVLHDDFTDIAKSSPLHAGMVFSRLELSPICQRCPAAHTCGGGYHPHRWSARNGFANPSVWCADLMRVFTHMRARLEVSPDQTRRWRAEIAAQTPQPELSHP